MNFFRYYQEMSLLLTVMFCVGLVLLSFVIYYSIQKYEKPRARETNSDEHEEPGIPLVLKLVYTGVAVYILCAVLWFALSGMSIG